MKALLLFLSFLITFTNGYCQCPFSVKLDSTGNCIGSTITVNTPDIISKIIWYNGNTPIDSVSSITYTSTLVAGGNGQGAATNQLDFPGGIYIDAAGNVYVSDVGNNRVQKFVPGATNGVTVAGGNGHGAAANQLSFPRGLYNDASGSLCVIDGNNNRVQKWAASTTSGVTIAGGNGQGPGANQLDGPMDLFIDASGNLYIADQANNRIQKWAPGATTGVTVAGGNGNGAGANQLSGAIGVYADVSGNIYVCDKNNHRIQKWVPGATSGVTVAGGNGGGAAANQLFGPNAVFVDAAGNIYVADYINDRIQEWAPGATSGITVAGGSLPNQTGAIFTRPTSLYVTSGGNIYVTVSGSNSVQGWGHIIAPVATSYTPAVPGNFYAVVINVNGCVVSTNAVEIYGHATPSIIINAPLVAVSPCTSVSFTAAFSGGGPSPSFQWQINGSAVGSNDSTFTHNNWQNGDKVTCIITNNSPCTTSSQAISNSLAITVSKPSAALLSSTGNCLGDTILLSHAGDISTITWSKDLIGIDTVKDEPGFAISTVAGGNGQGLADNQLNNPMGIAVDKNGNIYVADTYNNRIQKWAPGATIGVTVAGISSLYGASTPEKLNFPRDLLVADNGDIFISDTRVQKWVAGATSGTTVAGFNGPGGNGPEQLDGPFGLCMDALGNLLIVDQGNSRVQQWAPGAISGTTVAGGHGIGPAANQLDKPAGMFRDNAGNLYISDLANNRVQKWAPSASTGITVAGGNGLGAAANQLSNAIGVYVDSGRNVYVTDPGNNRVQKWAPGATSGITVAGGNGYGNATNQLGYPTGLTVDQQGNIYVVDLGNSRVQKWGQHKAIDTTYIPAAPGSYTATITNSGGCTITTNAIVINDTITPHITIAASNTAICSGEAISFKATIINGGLAPTYQWKVNGLNVGINGSAYSSTTLVNGAQVSCILLSNAPCVSKPTAISNNILIEVNTLSTPSIVIAASQTIICAGSTITFTASTANSGNTPFYHWKINGINAGTNTASFTSNTIVNNDVVSCVVTSSMACSLQPAASSNSISIHINSVAPSVSITATSNQICPGDPVTFTAAVTNTSGAATYQWQVNGIQKGSNSSIFTSNQFIHGDSVKCLVNDNAACRVVASKSVVIRVFLAPVITSDAVSIMQGQNIILNLVVTGNIMSYLWSPATYLFNPLIKNPTASPLQNITYALQAVSTDGCIATGKYTVNVYSKLNLPNAFTPNGDNTNDIFYMAGREQGSIIKDFSIFDRWGHIVFQNKNILSGESGAGWDGYYKGSPAVAGVYVYVINIVAGNGEKKAFKGTVLLIR